jgi:abequosyltransferase
VILSIIVPTYNRAHFLGPLLKRLESETRAIPVGSVEVVVLDNNSTDETATVIRSFSQWPHLRAVWQAHNVGPDENFCSGIEKSSGRHFWILGDDDLPRIGLLRPLLESLNSLDPDIVFLECKSSSSLPDQEVMPSEGLGMRVVSRDLFTKSTNVLLTFISGVIVKRSTIGSRNIRQHTGSNLAQTAWIFPALVHGEIYCRSSCVCVDSLWGNTGGYRVIEVFAKNFPDIVCKELPPQLASTVLNRTICTFLPQLLMASREGGIGDFSDQERSKVFSRRLYRKVGFYLLVYPCSHFPKPIALISSIAARILTRIAGTFDKYRLEKLSVRYFKVEN